jgi:hypothetical protein
MSRWVAISIVFTLPKSSACRNTSAEEAQSCAGEFQFVPGRIKAPGRPRSGAKYPTCFPTLVTGQAPPCALLIVAPIVIDKRCFEARTSRACVKFKLERRRLGFISDQPSLSQACTGQFSVLTSPTLPVALRTPHHAAAPPVGAPLTSSQPSPHHGDNEVFHQPASPHVQSLEARWPTTHVGASGGRQAPPD